MSFMAKQIIHVVTDDIDGSEDAETIQFSYGGVDYEIDLAERNQKRLDDFLAEFIDKARRVRRSSGSSRASKPSSGSKEDLDAIRAWARQNGHQVAERGRIAQSVKDAYAAAN